MTSSELFVSLKVPDNIAITAFHALERMGFCSLKRLERKDYYKFEFSGDKKNFENKISNVDILVNANKHMFSFGLEKNDAVDIIIQDIEKNNGLINSLKSLGMKSIKKAERGTLWRLYVDAQDKKKTAEQIAKSLLMNENYKVMRGLK